MLASQRPVVALGEHFLLSLLSSPKRRLLTQIAITTLGSLTRRPLAANGTSLKKLPRCWRGDWVLRHYLLALQALLRFNRATRVINRPVEELPALPTSEAAIIDPPWYNSVIEDWLVRASHAVEQGGLLLIPLMGELTRPSAAVDRAAVMAAMESIGSLTVLQGIIEYVTPLFEERALASAGIRLGRPWRIADLAIVRNEFPAKELPCTKNACAPEWTDYRIGDDIISVRSPIAADRSSIIPACPSHRIDDLLTLDSVSRRHPLLPRVNLWSSKNRIGRVEDLRAVRRALALIASAPNFHIEKPDSMLAVRLKEAFIEETEC